MDNNWLEISINTSTIAGELLSDFLEKEGAKGVVLGEWQPENKSEFTHVKAYFPEDMKDTINLSQKIQARLKELSEAGIITGAGEITSRLIKEEDWANSWKQYFHILHIGKNTVVRPVWEEYQAKEGERVINFDPGMAFGTGAHPSTRLCLEEIEELDKYFSEKNDKKVLDLGTGSGILTISLALSGFKNLSAIDIDPVAVRAAQENFRINHLEVNNFHGELKDTKENYDLIIGNILAEVIEGLAMQISEKLKSNGVFVGSGIIRQKEELVINALTEAGLDFKEKKYHENWVLIVFQKP